jgi:NAD+ diphosphatase
VEEAQLTSQFRPGIVAPARKSFEDSGESLVFAFHGDELLIHENAAAINLPVSENFDSLGLPYTSMHYLGSLGEQPCFAVDLEEDEPLPEGMALAGLRRLFGAISEELFQIGGRAFQVLNWDRTHRFCGRCGSATNYHDSDRARECPQCKLLSFPRVSPAIIVLVQKGHEFLLARNARFPGKRYSIIAGFVEPGETLEETVHREIKEEVGIDVRDVRYFGSQPWPFPHSLMVGFTAQYAGGEIVVDGEEIVDSGWYSSDNLPELPDGISISRRIIDWFLEQDR